MALATGPNPPKPRLSLRFGITGHRPNRLPAAHMKALKDELHAIFGRSGKILDDIHETHRAYFSGEKPSLKLISSLAEGADRITAWAAMDCGFELQAILPFSAHDYRRDFGNDESQKEFTDLLGRAAAVFEVTRERPDEITDSFSYEAAGLQMLKTCDVLIAIWDGGMSRGRGGSAEIVEAALAVGRPVIWFDTNAPSPARFIEPGTRLSLQEGPPAAKIIQAGDLETVLRNLALGPFRDPPRQPPGDDDPHQHLGWFYREREKRFNFGWAYPLMLYATCVRMFRGSDVVSAPLADALDPEWHAVLAALEASNPKAAAKLRDIVLVRYLWADRLANYYAQLYRSSYVRNFCFASVAVIAAVLGLLLPLQKFWLVIVELVLIGAIVFPTRTGQRRKWHARWIDCRHLAELLRPIRILYALGSELGSPAPQHGEAGAIESHWFGWYYRACARELGLAGIVCDEPYLESLRTLFHQTEVSGQMDYHAVNAVRMERLEERLDHWGVRLFYGTAGACVFYILVSLVIGRTPPNPSEARELFDHTISFLTTAMPAIGAAIYAIREQGDFKGVAERSRTMVHRLSEVETSLVACPKDVAHTIAHLTALAELAAGAMIGDLSDWRFVFRNKRLSLPA